MNSAMLIIATVIFLLLLTLAAKDMTRRTAEQAVAANQAELIADSIAVACNTTPSNTDTDPPCDRNLDRFCPTANDRTWDWEAEVTNEGHIGVVVTRHWVPLLLYTNIKSYTELLAAAPTSQPRKYTMNNDCPKPVS